MKLIDVLRKTGPSAADVHVDAPLGDCGHPGCRGKKRCLQKDEKGTKMIAGLGRRQK